MNNIGSENNKITIAGTVITNPEFSHEVYGEQFFTFKLEVPRLSETTDIIPVTISEKFLALITVKEGIKVLIGGQFRSYNNFSSSGNPDRLCAKH